MFACSDAIVALSERSCVSYPQLVIYLFSSFTVLQGRDNQDSCFPMSSPKFQYYLDGSEVSWQPIPRSVIPSELGLLQTRKEQQSNETSLKVFRETSKDPMVGIVDFLDSGRFH
jgi:hypothetical protein